MSVYIDDDGFTLYSGKNDEYEPIHILKKHNNWISKLVFTLYKGKICLYSGDHDGIIHVWENHTYTATLKGHTSLIRCLVYDKNRGVLYSSGHENDIRVWKNDKCIGTKKGYEYSYVNTKLVYNDYIYELDIHDSRIKVYIGNCRIAILGKRVLCMQIYNGYLYLGTDKNNIQVISPIHWTPKLHHRYPKSFKQGIYTFLLVCNRFSIPKEIALLILSKL